MLLEFECYFLQKSKAKEKQMEELVQIKNIKISLFIQNYLFFIKF